MGLMGRVGAGSMIVCDVLGFLLRVWYVERGVMGERSCKIVQRTFRQIHDAVVAR